jgi:hypothetical protein
MIVIGVDVHKHELTAVAVDELEEGLLRADLSVSLVDPLMAQVRDLTTTGELKTVPKALDAVRDVLVAELAPLRKNALANHPWRDWAEAQALEALKEENPEAYETFRERRAATGIGSVLCHALYLCNLATPDDSMYGKSIETMRATIEPRDVPGGRILVDQLERFSGIQFDPEIVRVFVDMVERDPPEGDQDFAHALRHAT